MRIFPFILFPVLICFLLVSCTSPRKLQKSTASPEGMVLIPGNGSQESFYMDRTEVTNAQFAQFVEATGYLTDAEKPMDWEVEKLTLPKGTPKPPDSLLAAGSLVFRRSAGPVNLEDPGIWWKWQPGANWKHPKGSNSSIAGKEGLPVVHVSWDDAMAYARWAGKRLPSIVEWEYAANGGEAERKYPWGNKPAKEAVTLANFWQGNFPYLDTGLDGYKGIAPVKSYPPNEYGLYELGGNVWEWCIENAINEGVTDPYTFRVKGGSFLCNDSYCSGYLINAEERSGKTTGLAHTGFRCVQTVGK